eukprot:TRINITY_DN26849_c0_g1_i1.p1 TRINITY_DN26849_c0_g1~~TRINITY_DN26849_c0_g1_i1.p1  ORF type:complete len:384 (-),score=21.51 TRINITY_DN26849_c0_g1_i1:210-1361(-)
MTSVYASQGLVAQSQGMVSGGRFNACRVGIVGIQQSSDSCRTISMVAASNNKLFSLKLDTPQSSSEQCKDMAVDKPSRTGELPPPTPFTSCSCDAISLPAEEIACVATDQERNRVAFVDQLGRVHMMQSTLQTDSADSAPKRRKAVGTDPLTAKWATFGEPQSYIADVGWAAVCFNERNIDTVCTSTEAFKNITVYQNEQLLHTFNVMRSPSCLTYLYNVANGATPLIVAADGPTLSIYDVRQPKQVKRMQIGTANIYSIAEPALHPNLLGIAGGSRSVQMVDTKKWCVRHSWTNVTKYECTYVTFSAKKPLCFAGGIDTELSCGQYIKEKKKDDQPKDQLPFGKFYGDSNWIGITRATQSDHDEILCGVTNKGSAYAVVMQP